MAKPFFFLGFSFWVSLISFWVSFLWSWFGLLVGWCLGVDHVFFPSSNFCFDAFVLASVAQSARKDVSDFFFRRLNEIPLGQGKDITRFCLWVPLLKRKQNKRAKKVLPLARQKIYAPLTKPRKICCLSKRSCAAAPRLTKKFLGRGAWLP